MTIVGKAHASVAEMVRDTLDRDFADDFDRHLAEHGASKALTIQRIARGMTQADVASKMGCGQAKVSKLERTADPDLNLGDVVNYARAVGQEVHLAFLPARAHAADQIRFHAERIKQTLSDLAEMADGDSVGGYAIENVEKYVTLIEGALAKLPGRVERGGASLRVEVAGEHGGRLQDDAPERPEMPTESHQRVGKGSRKRTTAS